MITNLWTKLTFQKGNGTSCWERDQPWMPSSDEWECSVTRREVCSDQTLECKDLKAMTFMGCIFLYCKYLYVFLFLPQAAWNSIQPNPSTLSFLIRTSFFLSLTLLFPALHACFVVRVHPKLLLSCVLLLSSSFSVQFFSLFAFLLSLSLSSFLNSKYKTNYQIIPNI